MEYRIKAEYADEVVGFAGSGKRLGLRTQDELQVLAELCSHNKGLIRYFENYPGAEAVAANKVAGVLEKTQSEVQGAESDCLTPALSKGEGAFESGETERGAEGKRPKHKRPAIVDPDIDAE